jgi:hypothetical protein
MARLGVYDGALQMYKEPEREADPNWLGFLVWLKERGDFADDMYALALTNPQD